MSRQLLRFGYTRKDRDAINQFVNSFNDEENWEKGRALRWTGGSVQELRWFEVWALLSFGTLGEGVLKFVRW